ncbi:MAG: hypothetical protein ACRYFZ_24365 [Janthinobacterium lividum]
MAQSIHQLLPEVAEKFRSTIVPCRIDLQWLRRTIDLRSLTLAEAEELVKDPKFTYLVPKRTRKKKAVAST